MEMLYGNMQFGYEMDKKLILTKYYEIFLFHSLFYFISQTISLIDTVFLLFVWQRMEFNTMFSACWKLFALLVYYSRRKHGKCVYTRSVKMSLSSCAWNIFVSDTIS